MLSAYTLATIPNSFSKELIDYCYDKYDIPLEILGEIFKYMNIHDIRHWSTNLKLSSRIHKEQYSFINRGYFYNKIYKNNNRDNLMNNRKMLKTYLGKNWQLCWKRWPTYTDDKNDKNVTKPFTQRTYNKIHDDCYNDPSPLTVADVLNLMPQKWLYEKATSIFWLIDEVDNIYRASVLPMPKKSWSKKKLVGYIWTNNYLDIYI